MVTTDTGMIFIPGNVPSSKNSKQMATTKAGVPVLLPPKTVKEYLRNLGIQKYSLKTGVVGYKSKPNVFKTKLTGFFDGVDKPCMLGMNFVRDSMRKFDFVNVAQIIADLIVAHGFIEDDNMNFLIPVPLMINGSFYSICRSRPGVYLKIITNYDIGFDL